MKEKGWFENGFAARAEGVGKGMLPPYDLSKIGPELLEKNEASAQLQRAANAKQSDNKNLVIAGHPGNLANKKGEEMAR